MKKTRTTAGIIFLTLTAVLLTLPFTLMLRNSSTMSREATSYAQNLAASDPAAQAHIDQQFADAQAYNQELVGQNWRIMGEVKDPWNSRAAHIGSNTTSQTSIADEDARYQNLLTTPGTDIISTISYPSLDINLPVRHGTTTRVLAAGAGHMYGTSLPVGGEGSNAVIAAHTGMASRMMFDRLSLGGAHEGDRFTVTTLGRPLHYRVTEIRVITPEDFSYLLPDPTQDKVTLLTCTPYGVNNQRLIVVGIRDESGQDNTPTQPHTTHITTNTWMLLWITLVWILWLLTLLLFLRKQKKHAAKKAAHTAQEATN